MQDQFADASEDKVTFCAHKRHVLLDSVAQPHLKTTGEQTIVQFFKSSLVVGGIYAVPRRLLSHRRGVEVEVVSSADIVNAAQDALLTVPVIGFTEPLEHLEFFEVLDQRPEQRVRTAVYHKAKTTSAMRCRVLRLTRTADDRLALGARAGTPLIFYLELLNWGRATCL